MTAWVDPDEQALADHLLQEVPRLRERCAAEARSTSSTWPAPAAPGREAPGRRRPLAAGAQHFATGREPFLTQRAPSGGDGARSDEETWPLGLVLEALADLVASTARAGRPALFRLIAPVLEHAAGDPGVEDALRYGLLDRLPEPDRALLAEAAGPALWESVQDLAADFGPAPSAPADLGGP